MWVPSNWSWEFSRFLLPPGIREIDHVRHALALGKDTYNDGRLSHEIVEEMCEVLNKFREVMKTYRVSDYRAFASSALREARNSQMVLDRILGAYRTPGPHDEQFGASF